MKVYDIPDIDQPDEVYLRRWRLIQTPWFGIYLHRINLPDGDRDLHNHPWAFRALILRGGYYEEFQPEMWKQPRLRYHGFSEFNKMPMHAFHRIQSLTRTPTWTLVFVGKRKQNWGFLVKDVRTPGGMRVEPWQSYVEERQFEQALKEFE